MIIIISYYILKKFAIFCKFIGLFKKLIKKVSSIQSKVLTENLIFWNWFKLHLNKIQLYKF